MTAGLRPRSDWMIRQEKRLNDELGLPVPQTDTGGQVEYTKASERTLVKELGKLDP